MAYQWFYLANGRQSGPVSSAEIKQLVETGQLIGDDRVKRADIDQWAPISRIRGLREIAEARANRVQQQIEEIVDLGEVDGMAALTTDLGDLSNDDWLQDAHDLSDRSDLAGYDTARLSGGTSKEKQQRMSGRKRTGLEGKGNTYASKATLAMVLSCLGFFLFGITAFFGLRLAESVINDSKVTGITQGRSLATAARWVALGMFVIWGLIYASVLASMLFRGLT